MLEHLVGGFGTAVGVAVAVVLVLVTAVLCLAGVGLLVTPHSKRAAPISFPGKLLVS